MLIRWFVQEGWVAVLAVLNLALAGFICWSQMRQDQRVRSIEIRFQGILERITVAYQKIDTVDRRVTGKFDAGNKEATKLKKALKKVKNQEEFDDQ